jgi:hypothetical protein
VNGAFVTVQRRRADFAISPAAAISVAVMGKIPERQIGAAHRHAAVGLDWGSARIGLRHCLLHRFLRCRQHHRYAADARPHQQGHLTGHGSRMRCWSTSPESHTLACGTSALRSTPTARFIRSANLLHPRAYAWEGGGRSVAQE